MLGYLPTKEQITIIYFWDGKYWLGQVMEYDIAVQKDSFLECKIEMREFVKKIYRDTCNQLGSPFCDITKPNYKYPFLWKLFSIREILTYDSIERDITNTTYKDKNYNESSRNN